MPTFADRAFHDLPKYAGIPVHFVAAVRSGDPVTSCWVHKTTTIKKTTITERSPHTLPRRTHHHG